MRRKPVLLIVDDEKPTRDGLARALGGEYDIRLAESGERALQILHAEPVDLVLTDLRMPGMNGLELLRRILAINPPPAVVLLTAYGNVETAVEAMKLGAYDFFTKPVHLDRLEMVLRRALETRQIRNENRRLREQLDVRYGIEQIVGQSAALREVLEVIRLVAPTQATVLIQGESGTGKEMVAQAIHRLSPRSSGPFVPVHCAALAPTLLESELFGHERGAFTGAVERRIGRFEMADGGTLFLDEVGEIPLPIQVKILRVLEERRFERVGGSQPISVDVRLIAATNRDLRAMVEAGTFREDLYFRLNVVTIHLPPLRDRKEDIPLLAAHFVQELAARHGRPAPPISPEVMDAFLRYSWPGNVRELRNVLERMVVLARKSELTVQDLPPELREQTAGAAPTALRAGMTMREAEKLLIAETLRSTGGNRARAAQMLGISRRTLQRKIAEHGLQNAGQAAEANRS